MDSFSLLLFTNTLPIFYILFLISAVCVCVSIMTTDGTSGVQGYTLQNKGEEKINAHKMGKEPELNKQKRTDKFKLNRNLRRPGKGDKSGESHSRRWSGLKANLWSLAANLEQLIILSLVVSYRRM